MIETLVTCESRDSGPCSSRDHAVGYNLQNRFKTCLSNDHISWRTSQEEHCSVQESKEGGPLEDVKGKCWLMEVNFIETLLNITNSSNRLANKHRSETEVRPERIEDTTYLLQVCNEVEGKSFCKGG